MQPVLTDSDTALCSPSELSRCVPTWGLGRDSWSVARGLVAMSEAPFLKSRLDCARSPMRDGRWPMRIAAIYMADAHGRCAACCSLTCHCHSRATDVVDRAAGQSTGRGTNAGHMSLPGAAEVYARPSDGLTGRRRHSYRTGAHDFDHIRFEAGGQVTLLRLEWASSRELTLPHGRPRELLQYEPRV